MKKNITLEHIQNLGRKSGRQLDAEIKQALEGWAEWDVFDSRGRKMGTVVARNAREALDKTGTPLTVSARKRGT